jgi:hypothetical protein
MKMSDERHFTTALNTGEHPVPTGYVFMILCSFQPGIYSEQLSNPEGNSCMVCMCIYIYIYMSRYVVTWKPSIRVILWRFIQVGVIITHMNCVAFFTKLSWINYLKSIYQTGNFAMRWGETQYYMDQFTKGYIFNLYLIDFHASRCLE